MDNGTTLTLQLPAGESSVACLLQEVLPTTSFQSSSQQSCICLTSKIPGLLRVFSAGLSQIVCVCPWLDSNL